MSAADIKALKSVTEKYAAKTPSSLTSQFSDRKSKPEAIKAQEQKKTRTATELYLFYLFLFFYFIFYFFIIIFLLFYLFYLFSFCQLGQGHHNSICQLLWALFT